MTKTKKTIHNPFYAQKVTITAAVRRSVSIMGAARILSRELNVPFQVARGVLLQNNRRVKRLCATK